MTLPDLQIKAPTRGNSSKHKKLEATDESFMLKSVASSRNTKRFFTAKHNRAHSITAGHKAMNSRYKQGTIPTDNLKFSQFLEILFTSGMTKAEIQTETQGYVQVLETNYTDKIRDCKIELEKMKR